MRVTLNINDDAELRDYVKDLIRGQVKSVIREEMSDILLSEIRSKTRKMEIPKMEVMMKELIEKEVRHALGTTSYNSFIQVEARRIIQDVISEAIEKRKMV